MGITLVIQDYSGEPTSKDKCPNERQKRRRHTDRTKSVVKTKTEIAPFVVQKPKNAWSTKNGKRQGRILLQSLGRPRTMVIFMLPLYV